MDGIAFNKDTRRLVLQERCLHELKARALTNREASGATVVEDVASDHDARAPALGIATPVDGTVDAIAKQLEPLDRHCIKRVICSTTQIRVTDRDVPTLVDLDCLLRVLPNQRDVIDEQFSTLLAMEDIAAANQP